MTRSTVRPARPLLVVGFDDSPGGRAALLYAADLAGRLDGQLVIVRAVDLVSTTVAPPFGAGMAWPAANAVPTVAGTEQVREHLQLEHDSLTGELKDLLRGSATTWTLRVENGPAHAAITSVCQEAAPYLVVVGEPATGFGAALEHLVSGSTARALEHMEWPLLLVPPHAAEKNR